MKFHFFGLLLSISISIGTNCFLSAETLPPLGDAIPSNIDEMWDGFDPRKEPLNVELLKEWEQDDIILRIIRYQIGVFKGQKSMMAAIYGFPKKSPTIPGLLQIHGGGQYADYKAVLTNAKRGYATLSIAWAGRISAPNYMVSPKEVKLFWANDTENPKYKLTTDWGGLDAYHAPSRNGQDAFPSIPVAEWTLDSVVSPRNNSWFLVTLAGRRGLTFLERQPKVNGEKLGVYGHSMGGKLTVMIAGSDKRVRAAVPSCGGISDRYSENDLHLNTVSDPPNLKRISCPILFLSPANDFHGRINDLGTAVNEIKSAEWRVSCSPHHNHQDTAEYEVATQIWFDQHLKRKFETPRTPKVELQLPANKLPRLIVTPDPERIVKEVEIYFTQHGVDQIRGKNKDDSQNTKHRFWKFCPPVKQKNQNIWHADLPIFSKDRPLWAYANVIYVMENPIQGAGYYYGTYDTKTFVLSSLLQVASISKLQSSNVSALEKKQRQIENFSAFWRNDWFSYNQSNWGIRTNKLYEPKWFSPSAGSRISLEVSCAEPNKMAMSIDGFGVELPLVGGQVWQRFSFPSSSFKNSLGDSLPSWTGIRELYLNDEVKLSLPRGSSQKPVKIGSRWSGNPPEFRNLLWIP